MILPPWWRLRTPEAFGIATVVDYDFVEEFDVVVAVEYLITNILLLLRRLPIARCRCPVLAVAGSTAKHWLHLMIFFCHVLRSLCTQIITDIFLI